MYRKKRRPKGLVGKKIACIMLALSSCIIATTFLYDGNAKDTVSSFINQTFDTNLEVVLPEYKAVAKLNTVEKYNSLKAINNDIVGWITVQNTNIDYPILYRDNSTYLYNDYNHTYNFSGSIFLDESCDPELDRMILLHGHNMIDGTMFGSLPKILNGTVPRDSIIELYNGEEIIQFEIFSTFYYSVDEMLIETRFTDDNSYNSYLQSLASYGNSSIETDYYGETIVMSTCSDTDGPGRIAVCARRKR